MQLVKKIRIKINQDCKNYLEFASEQCRLIYNFALAEQIEHYKSTGKSLSIYEQKKRLPQLKIDFPNYAKVYNKCLSVMYFRLQSAYNNFFRRIKSGDKEKGFPKFKRKNEFVSQEYPAMYVKKIDDYRFYLPATAGKERFIVRTYEQISDNYKTVTIMKNKENYFVSFIVEEKEAETEKNKEIIAIDLGVKRLVTGVSSNQQQIEVPKFSYYTKHLDMIRGNRDRCKKHSRRYKKWNRILHDKTDNYVNKTMDYLHKAAYWLVAKHTESTIVVGDLNLERMKTKQSWFNRIIQNEWRIGKFVRLLEYKSKKFGKELVKIDEKDTTKICSKCGHKKEMSLSDRVYRCEVCGLEIGRDFNSAINIMKKYCTAGAIPFSRDKLALARDLNVDTFVYI